MEDLKLIESALDKATRNGSFTLAESFNIVQSLQKVAAIVAQEGHGKQSPPVMEEPYQTSSE